MLPEVCPQLRIYDDEHRPCSVGPEAPVPILQWEWEFRQLLDLYRVRIPLNVLEIGTYHGGTLYHWLQNAAPDAKVVSVDSYVTGIDNRDLYADWTPEDVELVVIDGDAASPETLRKVIDALEGDFYDWIFIDAGHSYEDVSSDWGFYSRLADRGNSVIALHDIVPGPGLEVHKFWKKLQARGHVTQEIICDHVADWGGIGVVYL